MRIVALPVAFAALASADPALLSQAQASYAARDFRRAAEILEKAARQAPDNAMVQLWLGRAYGRRAETSLPFNAPRYASRARQHFEKSVALDPANAEALSDLMEYYLQAPGFLGGGLDKAEALLPKFRAIGPAVHESGLARVAEARKDVPAAERHLRRTVTLEPASPGRLLDLAQFLARHGRFPEALPVLESAARLGPGQPRVLYVTAELYIGARHNLPVARQLLQRYLAAPADPNLPSRQEAEKLLARAGAN
jgi:tetratricopeptide (TPR) repeat protein